MQAVLLVPVLKSGVQVSFAIAGMWPALAAQAASPSPPRRCQRRCALPPMGLGLALAGARRGALLNLMPCVFPILSLKVLGFTVHATPARAAWRVAWPTRPAWWSLFVALAALLLVLRAGGEQIGWGFQLQSPLFVAALAVLFTLIGLNLAGVFELARCCRGLAARGLRHPLVDRLLTAYWPWPWPRPAPRRSWAPRSGWRSRCRPRRP